MKTTISCDEWSESESCSVCLTLCNLIVHGVLQARILEWVAFPFSRGSSQPRDWTLVSHIAGEFFTSWTTREAPEYWSGLAYPFFGRSSQPRNQTRVSCIAGNEESACNAGNLGWEGPLEKGKATHSSILAWRTPWIVRSMGSQSVGRDWVTFTSLHFGR